MSQRSVDSSDLSRNKDLSDDTMPAHPTLQRIFFVDHTASMGGGEIALLNLVCHIDPSRYQPIVVLGSDGPLRKHLLAAGIETHLLSLSEEVANTRKDALSRKTLMQARMVIASLKYIFRLSRLMRILRADIVHTNSLKSDILGGLAARFARIPVIWHVRDRIDPDYLPRSVVRLFRLLCRRIPNHVIANSHATLKTLHDPRSDRQTVIYSGVDVSRFDITPREEEALARRNQGAFRIALVGRISPWKGQHLFVLAAERVLPRFPNAQFLIAGSALFEEEEYEAQIRAMIEARGLQDHVQMLGFQDDIPELMASLDLLVHASTSAEPFGQVVVQGMAAGRAVVASRGGGVMEIVEEGVTGILTPMGDADAQAQAILQLLEFPDRAAEMGRQGRKRVVDQFTIQASARRVERVYGEIQSRKTYLLRRKPVPDPLAAEHTA